MTPQVRLRIAAFTLLALLAAACQAGSAPASPASGPTAEPTDPAMSIGPPPSSTPPDDAAPVALDPALLELLPADVAGFPVSEALDEAAIALNDPALPRIATALDVGVAVDTANADLVSAWVVRLRDGAFGDDAFRQWRDSYDEGACAAAGGVTARAEATIAERTVHVTSCAAGLRTYHLWLPDDDLLISASSVGAGRFGELLMGTLRIGA